MNCISKVFVLSAVVAVFGVVFVLYRDQIVQYIPSGPLQSLLSEYMATEHSQQDGKSDYDRYLDTPHTRGKINAITGDYETFGGITCIANISDRYTNPGWARVYEFIETDPLLSKYYTPLPVSSYHMTIHPMFTVSAVSGSTPRRFDGALLRHKPGFLKFYEETISNPFEPQGKIVDTYVQGIIVIAVELDPEDQERAYNMRKLFESLTGISALENYKQHITLAYRKSPVSPLEIGGLITSLSKLRTILADEVLANCGGKLKFDRAQLMLFHDMAVFQPTNPNEWSNEPLGDLPPTPEVLKKKVKPEGWRAPWLKKE